MNIDSLIGYAVVTLTASSSGEYSDSLIGYVVVDLAAPELPDHQLSYYCDGDNYHLVDIYVCDGSNHILI